MGDRGSKLVIGLVWKEGAYKKLPLSLKSIIVKEQRVDDNYLGVINSKLRCILTNKGDYLINNSYWPLKIMCVNVGKRSVSNQISRSKKLYSTLASELNINYKTNSVQPRVFNKTDPFFLTPPGSAQKNKEGAALGFTLFFYSFS